MKKREISRRGVLKGSLMASAIGGTASFFGPWKHNRVWAQGAAKPIKLGLTCDASGQYGNSGQDDLRGIRMAIDEFNAKGGVLGRKIEWITADTETNAGHRHAASPSASSPRKTAAILIGALHSGVANAITQVANKYGVIYLNTNSSAPSEAGENCSRVKFVWDGNGTNFSKAAVQERGRDDRQELAAADQRLCLGPHHLGGDQGAGRERPAARSSTTCWCRRTPATSPSYLLKIQQAKPDVVATAIGGDDIKALRQQVAQLKLDDKAGLDQQPAGLARRLGRARQLFGVFGTTWYHKLPLPGVAEFVKRWQTAYRSRRSRCRATSPTTATWRRANCCARSSAPARPTTSRSSRSSKATRCRRPTACSISMPTSIRSRIRCSRRSIWRGATPSRPTRPTCSRSSAGPSRRRPLDDAAPAKCKLKALRAGSDRRRLTLASRALRIACSGRACARCLAIRNTRHVSLFDLLPHLLNGITLGLLFALIALGFMLILGLMEQINLAHGSLFALGAYFAYALMRAAPAVAAGLAAGLGSRVPLGWRYRRGAGPGAGPRSAPFGMVLERLHAPHLRQRSALRPAADLRRRHGDRGD